MHQPYFQRNGVVVIDDDPDFGKAITYVGQCHKMPVTHFESLDDLGRLAFLGNYDIAILDFYLHDMNGIEIAAYIDAFFPHLPVILTSGKAYIATEEQDVPNCIRYFMLKACGVENILASARSLVKSCAQPLPLAQSR